MEDNKKTVNKKSILDWVVCGIMVITLVTCFFFWGCDMDLWVSLISIILVVAGTVLLQMQNKKIKENM